MVEGEKSRALPSPESEPLSIIFGFSPQRVVEKLKDEKKRGSSPPSSAKKKSKTLIAEEDAEPAAVEHESRKMSTEPSEVQKNETKK